jgi:hypothetical protein
MIIPAMNDICVQCKYWGSERFKCGDYDDCLPECSSCGDNDCKNICGRCRLIDNDGDFEFEYTFITPDQWKARAGKELSRFAQVWIRVIGDNGPGNWCHQDYDIALYNMTSQKLRHQILIGGPEPPPDDWRPE